MPYSLVAQQWPQVVRTGSRSQSTGLQLQVATGDPPASLPPVQSRSGWHATDTLPAAPDCHVPGAPDTVTRQQDAPRLRFSPTIPPHAQRPSDTLTWHSTAPLRLSSRPAPRQHEARHGQRHPRSREAAAASLAHDSRCPPCTQSPVARPVDSPGSLGSLRRCRLACTSDRSRRGVGACRHVLRVAAVFLGLIHSRARLGIPWRVRRFPAAPPRDAWGHTFAP